MTELIPRRRNLRILVAGGRTFSDFGLLSWLLCRIQRARGIALIIHGAARGADTLAERWAQSNGVDSLPCPALWKPEGPNGPTDRAAGPKRNAHMLTLAPDGVVACPGGTGTAHMVQIATAAGIPVMQVLEAWRDRGVPREVRTLPQLQEIAEARKGITR